MKGVANQGGGDWLQQLGSMLHNPVYCDVLCGGNAVLWVWPRHEQCALLPNREVPRLNLGPVGTRTGQRCV